MNTKERASAKKIGRIMKTARREIAMTQSQVAKLLGVSQSALSKYESGKLIPSAVEWVDFCTHARLSPELIATRKKTVALVRRAEG